MGKHSEWRKLVKKLRRKRIRQEFAKKRDAAIEAEQKRRESSPNYLLYYEEQKKMDQFRQEEEKRLAKEREEQWLKTEREAQKQFRELQEKLAKIKEERLKEEERILQEWKREQEQIVKEKERKKKLKEENERKLDLVQQKIEEYITHGGELPEELKVTIETNPNKEPCPFFQKTSACRFKDICSRNHIRPGVSKVLLIPNFYTHFSLQHSKENEYGTDSSLEYDEQETYRHFKDFFIDVIAEFEKCGTVVQFKVCKNAEPHLRGNVYVEYHTTREALKAYKIFQGRWYAAKQLNVQFSSITSWKSAICGLNFSNRCPKGSYCNFLHVFVNPHNKFRKADLDLHRETSRESSKKSSRESSYDNSSSYSSRSWRWSESPDRDVHEKENYKNKNGYSPRRRYKRDRDDKKYSSKRISSSRSSRNRSKSTSRSPRSHKKKKRKRGSS